MATATPSPLASSVEKTNGNKLSRLLIDGGTTVLRNIFDYYHPPANLAANLSSRHIHPILTRLRHRNILNGSQWDKLFPPPGGGPPNSINFDITLLFLLLRNICSLHPPLSGWDKMPPVSDTSFEANLARIKYYRNELYGHVTTTGIQTPVFDVKWQEVSSVLVSLGLSQSEVNRLKREPCGEDYVSAVIEWMKNDEEIQFQLKDLRTKQQQVLQTQQEDHRTLHDTHKIVGKVQQTQIEASNLQQQDHKTLQDTHQAVGNLQQMLHEVRRTQQESQQLFKYEAANAEERRDKAKEDEALKKLAKVNTEGVIQYHSGKYQEGTRLHIFEKIKLWLDDLTSENRVMVISGDAGMGKSVIAAVVCQRMQHAGRLSGSYFCQHNKERYRNPKVMLQSLACQLCDVLPEYKSELVEKLSRNLGVDMNSLEVQELFEFLFEEPLCGVGDPGRNLLLVIDGLDESEYQGRNQLLEVIANHFCTLPSWVRFCVTARPEVNIAGRLKKFNPVQLKQDDEENVKDIRLFLERQLSNVIQSGVKEVVISELARKAAGHILYAYLMADFINKNFSSFTPEDLGRTLPSGVSSVYQNYFERLERELKSIEELTISADQFFTFLSAFAAAKEPLPLDFVSKMLRSDAKSPACHPKVRKAIECISTLLPVQDGCIHFFHKSVKDWLTDRTAYGQHSLSVDEKQGQLALSELCTGELNDVKRKGVHGAEFSDPARYALQHGVDHLLELEESTRASSFKEIVKNYVIDFEIVFAKLCVNNATSSEDIIRVQRHELFRALSRKSRRTLSTLLFLLRKYHERLTTIPSTFFQVMMKEGGKDCAKKAKELLHTQYHEIPFMKFVDKRAAKEQISGIQAVFRCTSQVACFDISPQQDFMVCECMDGTIQFWSLQTGKFMWKRPVMVEKRYVESRGAFRMMPNTSVLSCYRSVVFHSSEPIVLPGILSHAYSTNGDLLALFPNSNCRFTVCSVNGDSMITDSPGDAKCLALWSLRSGEEITRTVRDENVLSFAWSPDGKLLMISHFSGLCLVDASNCFETLAKVSSIRPYGMITFAPNLEFLFCWRNEVSFRKDPYMFRTYHRLYLDELSKGIFVLNIDDDAVVDSEPWDDESSSKGGFLMGDLMSYFFRSFEFLEEERAFTFVLNKQRVLRMSPGNNCITMFSPDQLKIARTMSCTNLRHVAFALDGKTVYGVAERNKAVVSFDVSSGKPKGKKEIDTCDLRFPNPPFIAANNLENFVCLVPVNNGVVLKHRGIAVQLWNFELSQQVQSWPSLWDVMYIMPVTDRCLACVGRRVEVTILDTSSGDIVKTIPICHRSHNRYESTYQFRFTQVIVCNRKYQLLSIARDSVQLSDDERCLWNRPWKSSLLDSWKLQGMFSPTEEFVLIPAETCQCRQEVHVLDASSGNTLRTLCTVDHVFNWAFVSDEECVIGCQNISESFSLQLFNVRTGDFLTVLDADSRPTCLASFLQTSLIAVGLSDSKRMCSIIEVRLPRDKVNFEAPACPKGWVENGNQCYFILPETKEAFVRGLYLCNQLGATLPIIKSAEQNAFLLSLMEGKDDPRLGMIGPNGDNVFEWLDGTAVADTFSAWNTGEPNLAGSENCGYLYVSGSAERKGKWNNDPCSNPRVIVCQMEKK